MKITEQLNDEGLLMEVGKRIAHLRVVRGLRQEDLARRCGISRFALSRLENGAGGVRLESFLSVLRQLDVLPRMELVLEEISLTPLQEAALESAKASFPKRVCLKRRAANDGLRQWGDGVKIKE